MCAEAPAKRLERDSQLDLWGQLVRSRLIVLLFALVAAPTVAAEPIPAELSERFARGLRLFAAGNVQGALLEFKYVHAKLPRPSVTYNLALVYAELGDPRESVVMADAVLADPGTLAPARLAKLASVRAAQLEKLGELVVQSDVEGAEVQVSGRVVGRTPIAGPLLVPTGRVLIGGQAPKHKPAFTEALVAPRSKVEVKLSLAPLEQQLGAVLLKARVPGADILVDGVLVGRTPELLRIPVEPGRRTVSLRRAGYVSASKDLQVGESAEVELELDPQEDREALVADGATLTLSSSEDHVVLTVDGQRRGEYVSPLRLPAGPHTVVAERGGFYPEVRRVTLVGAEEQTLTLTFEPTAELRADLAARQSQHRVFGWLGVGVGAALTGSMVGVLVGDASWRDTLRARNATLAEQNLSGVCAREQRDCVAEIDANNRSIQTTGTSDVLAVTGLGVGVAAVVTGVVLLATTPDTSKYEHRIDDSMQLELSLAPAPGGGLFSLSGRF